MEVGAKVIYKGDEYEILSKASIDFSVLNNVVRKADVYGLSIGIFWAEELKEVESFEDFAARTQTTEEPEALVYTEQQKKELIWDAENAAHQQHIDEQNTFHL